MGELCNQSFELDLENLLHVIRLDDVPCIAAARLGHRHQKIFVEVSADTDRRRADASLKKSHGLRDDLVSVCDADICESISDKHYAIDTLVQHVPADG